ncbi:hypothetical protein PYCCODRAFT_1480321 [Trametes coccinea BRFM310]|uniref:Uncharacterized protein n=1 Tax=Trametes coccinea (strain BRFM310) TaxID=1353009 RepID=A0A1Y2ICR5_TRAC3|nr:hypothetical protein PYCCODRAFT_1480321 [Trametes coccinea BRFM310]
MQSGAQQQSFFNPGLAFPSLTFDVSSNLGLQPSYSSQTLLSSQASLPGADVNSPEVFKQNIQLVQGQIVRVQSLARSALTGIEHAYHPGTNPVQTAADIAALKQALAVIVDFLRQTGVGALPLDSPPVPDNRTEEQLIAEATRAVQALYERQKRLQEGASVVANLLGAVDQLPALAGSQSQGSASRR